MYNNDVLSGIDMTNVVVTHPIYYWRLLNVGGTMDLATGLFTIPLMATYHFLFTELKDADDIRAISTFIPSSEWH